MFDVRNQHRIGRFAWVMAWVGLVVGQFHAMARHQIADGQKDLELPLTRAWSDPARRVFRPLLGWADPDTVYLTYGKIWLPVFVAFTLCAFVVWRRREARGVEQMAWRVTLTGYVLGCLAVLLDYYTQWTGYLPQSVGDVMFGFTLLAMLVSVIGSTVLGIALLRKHFRPALPAWLLALTIPCLVVVVQVTSMGSMALPWMFAFGILGRRIAREHTETRLYQPADRGTGQSGSVRVGQPGHEVPD